jgi:RPA family protein
VVLFLFAVDDGTGVVQCSKWVNEEELLVRRGDLVVVRGQIHSYQNRRELNVTHIRAEEDPHAEIFHWLQVIYLTRHVQKAQIRKFIHSCYIEKMNERREQKKKKLFTQV